ncbi:MAG: efflux transporter outer membrane subunit [Pseudomonadota bacterium]
MDSAPDGWFFSGCRSISRAAVLILLGSLFSCSLTVGPDYEAPEVPMLDQWHYAAAADVGEPGSPMYGWWKLLEDETLVALIEKAHSGNLDLNVAVARVAEFDAIRGIAAGDRVPDLAATGGAERGRGSDGISPAIPPQERTDTLRDIGLQSTWELDVWGRIRRSVESATASYEASIEDLRDLLVIVYADVGSSYVQVRTLQERLRLAKANVQLQRETLVIVNARNRAELAPLLDVRQAELNLAVTESSVPSIEASIATTLHRLGVLIGDTPGSLRDQLSVQAPLPDVPDSAIVSVPADTIRQRPDVRSAERQLAAQTAQIGVATAALYPSFFLSGDIGLATATGGLLNGDYKTWGLGALFSWDLFAGGRLRSAIEAEEARTRQALFSYEQAVLFAFQDVEDALISLAKERERLAALERSVAAAAQADVLVREQYRQGLTNFQNVLDTQRSLFNQQDEYAESQGLVLQELIAVYRAFGGGWDVLGPPSDED